MTNVDGNLVDDMEEDYFNINQILEQLRLGQYVETGYSFSGKVTDVNLWSRSLSPREVLDWARCERKLSPDIVDWETQNWILSGFSQQEESFQKICSTQSPGLIIQPNTATFFRGLHTCQMFDSEMGVCNSTETDRIIEDYFKQSLGERCLREPLKYDYWCGYTDQAREDLWLNVNNVC